MNERANKMELNGLLAFINKKWKNKTNPTTTTKHHQSP